MIEQNVVKNLTTWELRQRAKDMVDRMTDQECACLLEWAEKEFEKRWIQTNESILSSLP